MANNDTPDQAPDQGNEDSAASGRVSGSQRRRGRSARAQDRARPAPPDPSKLKFFTLIPAGTRIDFVGNRKRGLLFSLLLMVIAIGTLTFNSVSKGSSLNFGIDFQGGSSVRLALTQEADIEQLRALLVEEGYTGSSAVAVPDADNEVLIRVKEVLAISEDEINACRDGLGAIEEASLLPDNGFVHPEGSSKIFMKFDGPVPYAEIERLMEGAGCDGTASSGTGKEGEFPVEFALIGVGNDIAAVLNERLGEGAVDHIVASETVGAKVGKQLKLDGAKAMVFAIGFIFLFVMIRFDLRFAPGGIVALVHDTIIVLGAFALTGKEFNLQSIAAVLTIIGYSINDTIVVFDRVRERVALHRDDPIEETTNTALNETLSRTILTSTTTIIVVLATWILGSGPIKDFAFALFIGLLAGTYSSLYVAAPVFLWVNQKVYKGKGHLITAEKDAKRGTGTLLGPQVGDEGEAGEEPSPAGETPAAAEFDGEAPSPRVEDSDRPGGERKTRRRRRRPPGS